MGDNEELLRTIYDHQDKITSVLNRGQEVSSETKAMRDQLRNFQIAAARKMDQDQLRKDLQEFIRQEIKKELKRQESQWKQASSRSGKSDDDTLNLNIKSEVKVR